MRKDKARKARPVEALVPVDRNDDVLLDLRDTPSALRADIKAMVQQARTAFHADVQKVLTETHLHAAELEKAIGDISQADALQGVRAFFVEELDRQLAKY
jgi:hypothetical protein